MTRVPESEKQRIRDEYETEREKLGIKRGECFCGCGQKTTISTATRRSQKIAAGLRHRFIPGHRRAYRERPNLTEEYREEWRESTDQPYGFCWCGCGRRTKTAPQTSSNYGHVWGEPKRYLKGHSGRKRPIPAIDPETGCWNWTGTTVGTRGCRYGTIIHNGKRMGAHCHYYEKYVGAIPKGYHVHHRCRNTLCVNPEHLEAISPAEHSRLRLTRKLSHEDVREIKRLLSEGNSSRQEIAQRFGITKTYLSHIRNGRSWNTG